MHGDTAKGNQRVQVTIKVRLKCCQCVGSKNVAALILDPISATLVRNATHQVQDHIVTHGQCSRNVFDGHRRCRIVGRVEITGEQGLVPSICKAVVLLAHAG
jgi:hypothetical protein